MRTRLNDEFTARHQAADQLQQERDFSATLINSANMVICCMEPDLNIASINPAAILLTGYPPPGAVAAQLAGSLRQQGAA